MFFNVLTKCVIFLCFRCCLFVVVFVLWGNCFCLFYTCLYQGSATHKPAGKTEVKYDIKGVRQSDDALLIRKQEEEVTPP